MNKIKKGELKNIFILKDKSLKEKMSLYNLNFIGKKTEINAIITNSLNIQETPVGGQIDLPYVDGTTLIDIGDHHKGVVKLTAGAPFVLNPGDQVQAQININNRELFDPVQHIMVFPWGPSGVLGVHPCVELYTGLDGVTTQIQFTNLSSVVYNSVDLYFQYFLI